jgi:hypothetical protein
VRILIFPLVIMAQRNGAKMANNLPQLQALQLKMTDARQTGNQLEGKLFYVISVSVGTNREARASVVVKALCYEPEGRGFNTR